QFLNPRTVRIYPAPAPLRATVTGPTQHHAEARPGALALEEVVVTTTQREEQLNHVPIDMVVWTEADMSASGVRDMAQIAALTPARQYGYRSGTGGDGHTNIVIGGIDDRHGPTVGIYLDDTQILSPRTMTYGRSLPMTFDLERVEILRGPQTTLLGDHTLSGAVRFITNHPSLT